MTGFLTGAVVGLVLAAPVGPAGLLCIRRSMLHGALAGFVAGLGAGLADAVWAYAAVFGTGALSDILSYSNSIRMVGGLFLVSLAAWMVRRDFASHDRIAPRYSSLGDAATMFVVTISNPMILVAFTTAFAAIGILKEEPEQSFVILVSLGVFTGSAMVWLLISLLAGRLTHWTTKTLVSWVNRATAALIAGLGFAAMISVL